MSNLNTAMKSHGSAAQEEESKGDQPAQQMHTLVADEMVARFRSKGDFHRFFEGVCKYGGDP